MFEASRLLQRCLLAGLLASASTLAAAAIDVRQLQAACRADSAPDASLDDVQVRKNAAAPNDLPFYEARSRASGNSVRLYYEADLEGAAASKAACLMGALDVLAAQLPHLRAPVSWSPLVLTHSANYIPPVRDGEIRWSSRFASTEWEPANLRFLLSVMPHEETHLSQGEGKSRLPRWFGEGHADWAGLYVTAQVNPDMAALARSRRSEDARALGAAHLGAWGGLQVKPEAFERQLSAADRARRAKDPDFVPAGPFSFGPGDFAADMDNEAGRYGVALALFDGLEQRHGRPAVMAWVRAVIDGKDGKQVVPLARSMLGEDLEPLLR